jgi:type I restriction enzyme S subunit
MGVGQKIPEGYKQTEVGVIPEDWQFSEVGQISEKIGSGITPTGGSAIYKKSGRPFLRSQNVLWGKLNISDLAFISDEIHSTFASTEIKINDVLLNITGASIGRSAHATKSIVGGNVNQHVCIIRSKDRIVFSKFLSTLLVSPLIQKQIFSFQAGGNREGLNFQQVSRLCIPLPPLPEQKAIAKVLSDTDSLIESLDALIDKKKAIKQGAMQELLTGKRRLPGFAKSNGYKQTEVGVIPEDWEIYSIAELFSILRNASYSRAELSDSGEYGCIHYGDIHTRFSHLLDCDTHTLPALSHKQAAAYPLIKDGDLILADASEDL